MKFRGRINNNAHEIQGQIFEHNNKIIVRLFRTDELFNGYTIPFEELEFNNQLDFIVWHRNNEFIKKITCSPFLKVAYNKLNPRK